MALPTSDPTTARGGRTPAPRTSARSRRARVEAPQTTRILGQTGRIRCAVVPVSLVLCLAGVGAGCSGLPVDPDGDGVPAELGDCDNSNPLVYPGADEVCDSLPGAPGVDNDCDGEVDEDVIQQFYRDEDGDGFGLQDDTVEGCVVPAGYALEAGDCDDLDEARNPDAEEICDDSSPAARILPAAGIDNNCDGAVDEDADNDGVLPCPDDEGEYDCNNAEATVFPGADEVWGDGLDNDCDGRADADIYVFVEGHPLFQTFDRPIFASIQGAIDIALDGQLIGVGPGVYRESVKFRGHEVVVLGLEGSAETTVDPEGEGSAFRFESGEGSASRLDGFTLTGGSGTCSGLNCRGGGVYVDGASPTLRNLLIVGNSATRGGGIFITGGGGTLEKLVVDSNAAVVEGGGICLEGADVALRETAVQRNLSGGRGGGLYSWESKVSLENVFIGSNRAMEGGGIAAATSILDLKDVRIASNSASFGGGIFTDRAQVDAIFARVEQNSALASGGGLYLVDTSDMPFVWQIKFEALELEQNSSGANGGGGYLENVDPVFKLSRIAGNRAEGFGGGLFGQQAATSLTSTRVVRNVAAAGGGLYGVEMSLNLEGAGVCENESASDGGGLFLETSGLTATGVEIGSNSAAGDGGGVYAYEVSGGLIDTLLAGNLARSNGGGAMVVGLPGPDLDNVQVSGNTASGSGGGILVREAEPTFSHVLFDGNQAGGQGGGIAVEGGGPVFRNLAVSDNEASGHGGGLAVSRATVSLQHGWFSGNDARNDGGGAWIEASGFEASSLVVRGNVGVSGAGILARDEAEIVLKHTVVVGNISMEGSHAGVVVEYAELELSNSILAWNTPFDETGSGVNLALMDPIDSPKLDHNLFFDGAGAGVAGVDLAGYEGVLLADPRFVDDPSDNDWQDDDYHLSMTSPISPAIDAGAGEADPDGSEPDLGAYGGPGASGWDLDGDGIPQWWDPRTGMISGENDGDDLDWGAVSGLSVCS